MKKKTVGRDDFEQRFITPQAQQAFSNLAPQQQKPAGSGGASKFAVGQTVKLKNGQSITIKHVYPDGSFD